MLSIQTQETKQSTTCEGVSFTIRKLSRIQRSLRDLPIFEQRLKADDLTRQWWELKQKQEAGDTTVGAVERPIAAALASVDYEFSLVMSAYLWPASIRAGLVSITGLEINGQAATPELLATSATPELDNLVREIYAECEIAAGLTVEQKKNSQSPTTSPERAAGEETNSTVITVAA